MSEQVVFNGELKLLIIYCDDTYLQDLLDYLSRNKLSFHVVLVSFKIPPMYLKGYYKGDIQSIHFLRVDCVKDTMMITKFVSKGKKKIQVAHPCLSPISTTNDKTQNT